MDNTKKLIYGYSQITSLSKITMQTTWMQNEIMSRISLGSKFVLAISSRTLRMYCKGENKTYRQLEQNKKFSS